MDHVTREYIDTELCKLRALLTQMDTAHRDERTQVMQALSRQESQMDRLNLHMENELKLSELQLKQMALGLDRLNKIIDGNGHGSIPTRLQLLEQDMQELIELRSADRRWWGGMLHNIIPIIVTWVGAAAAWLIVQMGGRE